MISGKVAYFPLILSCMQITPKSKAIVNYRTRVTMWLTVSALVILPPFLVNNFWHGRYVLGVGSFSVVLILVLQAWFIFKGSQFHKITAAFLAPALIVYVAVMFYYQSIIGALWCYPSALVFYFILPRRQAIFASICLLAVAIPSAWIILDPAIAARVAATLLAVVLFSAIFVLIIEQQQQELEQKEILRRDSMASASHELRTPLATMMAQIEAMRDGIRPLNQQQLSSLSRSADHLTNLVDDLSLLSLADVRGLSFIQEPVNVSEIVGEAVSAAKSKLIESKLTVELSLEKDTPVNGDQRRLRQIVDNLLGNCCRYANPGGIVAISTKSHNGRVELAVADSGPGVSDEQLELLFDKFFRADKSRSRQQGGSGLGLSLVKAFTKVHGGSVTAFHAPQGGLGIKVFLPTMKSSYLGTNTKKQKGDRG
jgi:signal transduction histidine kinase